MAGGPKETAGSQVTLTRLRERGHIDYPGARQDEAGKYDVLDVDLKDVMEAAAMPARIPIAPYDVVTVSEYKPQRVVHIAGEVNKPGAVELVSQDTVSLMKVLAVAGGFDAHGVAGEDHDRAPEREGRADLHRFREPEEDHERERRATWI